MNRITELEEKITHLTNKINSEYPELMKYILEIPVKNAKDEEVNYKNLKDYHQSLTGILTKYANTHGTKNKK
jgi:hypothetical protein